MAAARLSASRLVERLECIWLSVITKTSEVLKIGGLNGQLELSYVKHVRLGPAFLECSLKRGHLWWQRWGIVRGI